MLNKKNERELAYVVKVDNITPMDADRLECAHIGGWACVVGKGEFQVGDPAIYFEIDAQLPETKPWNEMAFLVSKHYKIKTQKIRGVVSQGLLVPASALGWTIEYDGLMDTEHELHKVDDESRFVTKLLGVTYATPGDNVRKSNGPDKYKRMAQRHPKIFANKFVRKLMRYTLGRKIMYMFFGRKTKKTDSGWPVGQFPGVNKTDQERVENMPWILNDKTPFIRTQKCDGSSGTYILARKPFGRYEFYVCSRNVRFKDKGQECFYGTHNYYWEVAEKYNIEQKMRDYLNKNKDIKFVCWQGEICAPGIQGNPHALNDTHFYCFHMTDSKTGRYDIREAAKIWKAYDMEVVPIDDDLYIMPDDFEEFKVSADGLYDASVCEGLHYMPREGYVYYKVGEPTFSFKNVSRKYLLKHNG